jgi:hypothetical protein
VPRVQVGVHLLEVHRVVVRWAGGRGNRDDELVAWSILSRVCVQSRSHGRQQEHKVGGLGLRGGILPVNVDSVHAPVLHQSYGSVSKVFTRGRRAGRAGKVGGVGPASDTKEDLEGTVSFLEEEELFDASVGIVTRVIPRVGGVVLVCVGIRVGGVSAMSASFGTSLLDLHCPVGSEVGKGIQHTSHVCHLELLRLKAPAVDCPDRSARSSRARRTHQFTK